MGVWDKEWELNNGSGGIDRGWRHRKRSKFQLKMFYLHKARMVARICCWNVLNIIYRQLYYFLIIIGHPTPMIKY